MLNVQPVGKSRKSVSINLEEDYKSFIRIINPSFDLQVEIPTPILMPPVYYEVAPHKSDFHFLSDFRTMKINHSS